MKYVSFMTQNENKFNFLRFSTISIDFFKPEVPRNRLKPFFLNLKLKKGWIFSYNFSRSTEFDPNVYFFNKPNSKICFNCNLFAEQSRFFYIETSGSTFEISHELEVCRNSCFCGMCLFDRIIFFRIEILSDACVNLNLLIFQLLFWLNLNEVKMCLQQ